MKREEHSGNLRLVPESNAERMLSRFERALADAVLRGDDPRLETARAQLRVATVECRELTPWGFYIDLRVSADVPAGDPAVVRSPLGGASIAGAGLSILATAHLNCRDGRISSIEAVAVGEERWAAESIERYLTDREPTALVYSMAGQVEYSGDQGSIGGS